MNYHRSGFNSPFKKGPRPGTKTQEAPTPAKIHEPAPAETRKVLAIHLDRDNKIIHNGVVRVVQNAASDTSDGWRITFREGDHVTVDKDDEIDVPA